MDVKSSPLEMVFLNSVGTKASKWGTDTLKCPEENSNFSQNRPLKAIPWKKMVKVNVLKYSTGYASELESP